jgi:hypothetical protein
LTVEEMGDRLLLELTGGEVGESLK